MADEQSSMAEFHARCYELIRQVPVGKVTTYGAVARAAGFPRHSRQVGVALKHLPLDSDIPWQRVISSKGTISPRGDGGLASARQRERLEAEGVVVVDDPQMLEGPGGKISLAQYQYDWPPWQDQ